MRYWPSRRVEGANGKIVKQKKIAFASNTV